MVSPFKTRIGSLLSVFALPVDDPDLACSQIAAFSKQIPLLYTILTINAAELAATHARTAPPLLTIVIPLFLCLSCSLRCIYWLRLDVTRLSGAEAVNKLRSTMRLVSLFGMVFTGWSLSLYPYGDAYAKCHVAFYMAITVISCILCLMHLRGRGPAADRDRGGALRRLLRLHRQCRPDRHGSGPGPGHRRADHHHAAEL